MSVGSPDKGRSPAGGLEREAPARRRRPLALPAARASGMLLIRIAPGDTGLFRYLLEGGGEHLAMLTVLDPKKALFKLLFSPHQRERLDALLASMRQTVPFEIEEWPLSDLSSSNDPEPQLPSGGKARHP